MKKLVSLTFALLLCCSVAAASLWTVGSAAEPDPAPKPTVTVIPIDPEGPKDPGDGPEEAQGVPSNANEDETE